MADDSASQARIGGDLRPAKPPASRARRRRWSAKRRCPARSIWPHRKAWWRRRAAAAPPNALLVTLRSPASGGAPEADFALRRRGKEASLGRFSLDAAALAGLPAALRRRPRRVVLRPPPGTLLEREGVLPLAAQHDPA